MMGSKYHLPVMLLESIEYLDPQPGNIFLDATLGGGGHAGEILKRIVPDGRLIAIDRDSDAIEEAKRSIGGIGNVEFIKAKMSQVDQKILDLGINSIDGAIADLGVSSYQLNEGRRGFSFMRDGPLDMRMGTEGPTAAELIEELSEDKLRDIIRDYGEERFPGRIARAIKEAGCIESTSELASIVERAVPARARRLRIHPATRTFQALRIAVNDELGELKIFLEKVPPLLSQGGRLLVISYHSLEDRIVKHGFRKLALEDNYTLPFRKAMKPSDDEISKNPRARSAKLRVIERVATS